MKYTSNLNLKKPEYWELADIEDINENMDVLDEAVKNKADKTQVLTNVPSGAKFTDTITTINGKTGAIGKADIVALGIPSQDTVYSEISTTEIDTGTSTTLRTITGRRVKYIIDKVSTMISTAIGQLTKSDIGLGNVDNVQQATKVEFNTHNTDATRHITSAERTSWNTVTSKAPTVHNHTKSQITDFPTSLPASGGNADTVGGFTVGINVPSNAKFTDTNTTYSEITTAEIDAGTASTSRVISGRRVQYILNKVGEMISTAIGALNKSSVGLNNVDNTSDLAKPISSATQTALNGKVDNSRVLTDVPLNAKFTDTIYTHPSSHPASMITESTTKRFVSDAEKATWNGKANLASPTFTGTPKTTANTSYTTGQLRNIRLYSESETIPALANGEIALIYSTAVMP